MSGDQQQKPVATPKVSNDEKNLVVSFIQFLRHKVSTNQCTEDQIEGLEGLTLFFYDECLIVVFSGRAVPGDCLQRLRP